MSSDHPGMVSLKSFLLGTGLIWVELLLPTKAGSFTDSIVFGFMGVVAIAAYSLTRRPCDIRPARVTHYQIQSRAFFLGWGLSCGFRCVTSGYSVPFGFYISLLSLFHYSEFLVTSVISPDTLSLDSFLLNHSKEYGIAALASVVEFVVELYFVPSLKNLRWVTFTGIGMCLLGEVLRKWAMLTASRNFTHLVRDTKEDGQYLVTSGPYSTFRHPGYAGWFWWSVGTQLVQVNPFCAIAYCLAVYKFFKSRIYYEEICLISFFGLDYIEYQKKVPSTGVPFVRGYIPVSKALEQPLLRNEEEEEEEEDSSSTDDNFQKVECDQLEDD